MRLEIPHYKCCLFPRPQFWFKNMCNFIILTDIICGIINNQHRIVSFIHQLFKNSYCTGVFASSLDCLHCYKSLIIYFFSRTWIIDHTFWQPLQIISPGHVLMTLRSVTFVKVSEKQAIVVNVQKGENINVCPLKCVTCRFIDDPIWYTDGYTF